MASRGSEKKYTTDDKRTAIELGQELGPAKTARQIGIPQGALTCWMFEARQAAESGKL